MSQAPERRRISALKSPGFRRYASVQFLSSMSVNAQRVAELWLVFQITGEGLSLGTSTAIRTAPTLVLAGLAGSLADRFSRKGLLIASQGTRGMIIVVFAVLTTGRQPEEISIVWVYLLVLALGCVGGFDQPIRRAVVRDVVSSEDLPSAASLHTATIATGRIVGPLCAGALMTWVGAPAAFIFGSASAFLAVVFVRSLRMHPREDFAAEPGAAEGDAASDQSSQEAHATPAAASTPAPPAASATDTTPAAAAIPAPPAIPAAASTGAIPAAASTGATDAVDLEGVEAEDTEGAPPAETPKTKTKTLVFSPRLRPTYLMLGAFSLIGMNVEVVFPLIAKGVLEGGVGTFSALVTYMSAGALIGSLLAAARASRSTSNRRLVWALVLCSAALISISASSNAALVAVTVVAAGFCTGLFLSISSANIQTGATREVQGRQAALYSFVFVGSRAVGSPAAGWLADQIGARPTIVLLSMGTLLAAVLAFALVVKLEGPPPSWSARSARNKARRRGDAH